MSDLAIFKNDDFKVLRAFLSEFTKRAYFVGGCVRDALLGRPCYDYDIEIYDILPELFDKIMIELGAKGVGKSFFVYKYKNFDLALARSESKVGQGHRGFKVRVCGDERLASLRRDFTINAIMCNIFTGEILDFHNGLNDLKNKTLKIVSKNTFIEDSLRVLRAVQFVSRFDLKVDKSSLEIMRKIDISDLSSERIRVELSKLFAAKSVIFGLELLRTLGLDKKIFGVKFSKNFSQKAQAHKNITNSEFSVPYDIFCDYGASFFGFESVKKQPILKRCSAKKLLEIALKMPLKNFLGINTKERKNLALKLGVWNEKLKIILDEKELKKMDEKSRIIAIKEAKNQAINSALKALK